MLKISLYLLATLISYSQCMKEVCANLQEFLKICQEALELCF